MKLLLKGKCFDLQTNSLNFFVEEKYADQYGESVSGYWGFEG